MKRKEGEENLNREQENEGSNKKKSENEEMREQGSTYIHISKKKDFFMWTGPRDLEKRD